MHQAVSLMLKKLMIDDVIICFSLKGLSGKASFEKLRLINDAIFGNFVAIFYIKYS